VLFNSNQILTLPALVLLFKFGCSWLITILLIERFIVLPLGLIVDNVVNRILLTGSTVGGVCLNCRPYSMNQFGRTLILAGAWSK